MEFQIEASRTWDMQNTRCRGCIKFHPKLILNLQTTHRADTDELGLQLS